jgi:S1-C subfamily serine protease
MDFMKPIGLSTDAELRVMRTTSGEQADAKGIRPGMRVVAIGGYVVSTEFQLRLAVAEYRRRTSSECAVVFLQERP